MIDEIEVAAQGIADALAPAPSTPSVRWRWGTVTSVMPSGTMNVNVGGSILTGVRAAQHCMGAKEGDRVRVSYYGTDAVVDMIRGTSLETGRRVIRSGTYAIPSGSGTSGTGYKDYTVSYDYAFDEVPETVVATLAGGSTAGEMGKMTLGVVDFTTTSFTFRLWTYEVGTSRNPSVRWVAVGREGAGSVITDGGEEPVVPDTTDVTFTANSTNWTPSTASVKRNGKVVTVTLSGQCKAGIGTWSGETGYPIGTCGVNPSAYTNLNATLQISSKFVPMQCGISSTGIIYVRTAGDAVPANTWTWISGTYITA